MTTFRLTEQHYDLPPGLIMEYVQDDSTAQDSYVMRKFGVDSSPLYIVPTSKLSEPSNEHYAA